MRSSSVAFIFLSFISTFLLLIPSKWHWKSRNAGTILIIGWTCLGNIVEAVSNIIFLDAREVTVPGWCDFGASMGSHFHHMLTLFFSWCNQIPLGQRLLYWWPDSPQTIGANRDSPQRRQQENVAKCFIYLQHSGRNIDAPGFSPNSLCCAGASY